MTAIITTFAVVAGFTGAAGSSETIVALSFFTVLLFGLANLFADALSMGLGNFLAIKAEKDVYSNQRENLTLIYKNNPKQILENAHKLLKEKGFNEQEINSLENVFSTNENFLIEWLMQNQEKKANPEQVNPVFTGIVTFIAFLIFGFIPLIPFFFDISTSTAFLLSSLGAFFALVLLGVLKWFITEVPLLRAVSEMVLIGGIAALAAFSVGLIFRNI